MGVDNGPGDWVYAPDIEEWLARRNEELESLLAEAEEAVGKCNLPALSAIQRARRLIRGESA